MPGPGTTTSASGTASRTLADLLPRAVEAYGSAPAVMYKDGGEWLTRSFTEVGDIVAAWRSG